MYHSQLHQNNAHPQPHDSYAMLQQAMQLPSQVSAVADWIFGEHDRDFHVTETKLSPEAFKHCSVLMSKSEFREARTIHRQNASNHVKGSEDAASSLLMLQIPTKEIHGIFLGYTFSIGVPFDESLFATRDALSNTFCLVGRFAFDSERKHMLVYITDLAAKNSVLMELNWINHAHRRRCYFLIPNEEYSFYNLPSEVKGVTVNDEYVQAPSPSREEILGMYDIVDRRSDTMTDETQPRGNSICTGEDNAMNSDIPNTAVNHSDWSTSLPWADDVTELHPNLFPEWEEMNSTAPVPNDDALFEDGNHFSPSQNSMQIVESRQQERERSEISDGLHSNLELHPKTLYKFLHGMGELFTGKFFSPGVIREIKVPNSYSPNAKIAGQVDAHIRIADKSERSLLADFAARRYFESTMAASNDRYFFRLEYPEQNDASHEKEKADPFSGKR